MLIKDVIEETIQKIKLMTDEELQEFSDKIREHLPDRQDNLLISGIIENNKIIKQAGYE